MATPNLELDHIEQLRTLPLQLLRVSALVDFILFFACGKPAVRTCIDEFGAQALHSWCERWGFDFACDDFACVTRETGFANGILEIDRSVFAHEIELGVALGYPLCCCKCVAALGESNIDLRASEIASWPFTHPYHRINPAGYESGLALISHLPCSSDCRPSLEIANKARDFIMLHATEPMLFSLSHSYLVAK